MASLSLHRPVTFARRGMVVAPHYLAAEAGLELLKAGGNALDAAVAASAMLQVVYPFVCGLGGDVFMIIYDAASGKLHGLNGSGRSARAATIERYATWAIQQCRCWASTQSQFLAAPVDGMRPRSVLAA